MLWEKYVVLRSLQHGIALEAYSMLFTGRIGPKGKAGLTVPMSPIHRRQRNRDPSLLRVTNFTTTPSVVFFQKKKPTSPQLDTETSSRLLFLFLVGRWWSSQGRKRDQRCRVKASLSRHLSSPLRSRPASSCSPPNTLHSCPANASRRSTSAGAYTTHANMPCPAWP